VEKEGAPAKYLGEGKRKKSRMAEKTSALVGIVERKKGKGELRVSGSIEKKKEEGNITLEEEGKKWA